MKREFLKGLGIEGLTDEIIDKIMSENGKDISKEQQKAEKTSQELENLKSELDSKEQLINDANSQIEKFKGMDIDGIKKQADDWKTKYEQFEANAKTEKEAYEKKLADQNYDFAVKELASKHKFVNDFVKNAFVEEFKKQGLTLDDQGKFLGADDYMKGFQEKNPGVFATEETKKEETQQQLPSWTVPTNQQTSQENPNPFGWNFLAVKENNNK